MKFPLGINNIEPETALPEGALRKAKNIDLHNDGSSAVRRGFTQIYSGTPRNLFKRFFAEGDKIKYLEEDNTATEIALTYQDSKISYVDINNSTCYTDGVVNGVLHPDGSHSFGISTPKNAPSLQAVSNGSLSAGIYQVTAAYIDQDTGEVSGTPTSNTIEIQDGQAIEVNQIPQSNTDVDVIIYATTNGGTVFYEQKITLKGTTETTIRLISISEPFDSKQNLDTLPSGHLIAYYRSMIYIANENILWYSEPYQFSLCDLKENFYQFPERITICLSVEDGLYIVADKAYFLSFNTHAEAQLIEVHGSKAVENTGLIINGDDLTLQTKYSGKVAYWFSSDGPIVGLPGGQVELLTEKVFAVDDYTDKVGTSLYSEYNGIKQVVSTMPSGGPASEMASTDGASLTIIRNGVEI